MIAVLLIFGVVVGIGYPYFRNAMASRSQAQTESPEGAARFASVEQARPIAREELCPSCSRMNPPGSVRCFECGGEMAVTNLGKLFGGGDQAELIREGIQAGGLLVLMLIAMALANFLPIGGKIVLLLLTIAALGVRLMRTVQS